MNIQLSNIGKRYGRNTSNWIFRDINQEFNTGHPCAIIGPNGSGKSTLLKIISGGLTPTLGHVSFINQKGDQVNWADVATQINFASPYTDLIEYFTLKEHIQFHFKFKSYLDNHNYKSFLETIDLVGHEDKLVKDFSSGMKQRLKLAFAMFTENPIILLDEPTSNLDKNWSEWYLNNIQAIQNKRLLIIASNDAEEYSFCEQVVSVE